MTKTGEHVLVVDDEPQILRALGVILRNAGYAVATDRRPSPKPSTPCRCGRRTRWCSTSCCPTAPAWT